MPRPWEPTSPRVGVAFPTLIVVLVIGAVLAHIGGVGTDSQSVTIAYASVGIVTAVLAIGLAVWAGAQLLVLSARRIGEALQPAAPPTVGPSRPPVSPH